MTKIKTIIACLFLTGCYGTMNVADRGNIKELVYSGFSDATASQSNQIAMQYTANKQCPAGYQIIGQQQQNELPKTIKWKIKCQTN